ncbi:LxmA leader domain family RiPP [Streptomyces sp. MCA2]|uniref:LxmA leader domain family RiPP n=1 Tax=Streptomyces TaxID=1883 RepID=UPI0020208C46|nr:LxmA leader domain family RiPP [Streptomyces sp. MCA2]MCL7490024.1 LxmA leader domain family RiPP [Streptomyces sp. MCA2]
MNTADQLISGYTAYTDAADFGASAGGQAPATTPSILSVVATSTGPCGAAASMISGASISATAHIGC